eukprot:g4217.t1
MTNFPQGFSAQSSDAAKFKLLQSRVGTGMDSVAETKINEYIAAIEKAAAKYPKFLNESNEKNNQRELCAYLTIINWETDFVFFQEAACKDNGGTNSACDYIDANTKSIAGKQYYGRGPKQLSWNYNYLAFSMDYFGDDRLLSTPELVFTDQEVSWASSMFFWMSEGAGVTNYGGWCPPQGNAIGQWPKQVECTNKPDSPTCASMKKDHYIQPGKSSPHNAIHISQSMPEVINIVNGGYDCCPTTSYGPKSTTRGHTTDRMTAYSMCINYFNLFTDNTIVNAFDQCPALSATNSETCPDCSCLTCKKTGNASSFPIKCEASGCPGGVLPSSAVELEVCNLKILLFVASLFLYNFLQ